MEEGRRRPRRAAAAAAAAAAIGPGFWRGGGGEEAPERRERPEPQPEPRPRPAPPRLSPAEAAEIEELVRLRLQDCTTDRTSLRRRVEVAHKTGQAEEDENCALVLRALWVVPVFLAVDGLRNIAQRLSVCCAVEPCRRRPGGEIISIDINQDKVGECWSGLQAACEPQLPMATRMERVQQSAFAARDICVPPEEKAKTATRISTEGGEQPVAEQLGREAEGPRPAAAPAEGMGGSDAAAATTVDGAAPTGADGAFSTAPAFGGLVSAGFSTAAAAGPAASGRSADSEGGGGIGAVLRFGTAPVVGATGEELQSRPAQPKRPAGAKGMAKSAVNLPRNMQSAASASLAGLLAGGGGGAGKGAGKGASGAGADAAVAGFAAAAESAAGAGAVGNGAAGAGATAGGGASASALPGPKRVRKPGQAQSVISGAVTQSSVGALLAGYSAAGAGGSSGSSGPRPGAAPRPSLGARSEASEAGVAEAAPTKDAEKKPRSSSRNPGESKTVVSNFQSSSAVSGLLGAAMAKQSRRGSGGRGGDAQSAIG